MKTLFWTALTFIAYTYVGYPLLVYVLGRLLRRQLPAGVQPTTAPTICILIAVHNEQHRIHSKLENLRSLEYPGKLLRVLFVSDGSTDATNECLRAATEIDYIAYPTRRGKAHALNVGIESISDDIVVFTDVRQTIARDALTRLLGTLSLPEVGAVSGELVHRDAGNRQAAQIGLYWRYEKCIRKWESLLASTVGTTGALYAVRRRDVCKLPDDALLDDFEIPMAIVRKGMRVVLDSNAIVYDTLETTVAGERRRKVRTLAGNFQSFARNRWLFVPWKNPIWWQFMSHKVFRLLVPYALLAALIASLSIADPLYRLFGYLQLLGYLLAVCGLLLRPVRNQPLISALVVFVELNWASVLGLAYFVTGRATSSWKANSP